MISDTIIFYDSTLNGVANPLGRAGRVDNGVSSAHSLHLQIHTVVISQR